MRKCLATVVAVAALAVLPTQAHADEPTPTRVLVVGDSITQGKAGDVTWRYHYWDAFRSNIDLVGPKQGQAAPGGGPDVMEYPHVFDYDHASRWGMLLQSMDWSVADLMAGYTPDVVVSQLGVNDLIYVTDAAGLLAGQEAFVEQVRAADPGADVVLGQLSTPWNTEAAEYNMQLPALVASLDTPASRVVMAAMPPMSQGADTYDGTHPNAQGEVKIAAGHEAALVSLGVPVWSEPVVTPPPSPPPTSQAPSVPRRVKAVRLGARVKVTWRAGSGASSYVAKCGKVKRSTTGLKVRIKSTSDRCRVRSVNSAGKSAWVVAKMMR